MEHQNDFLMHHGVEGQKWGRRHGPPYPLDDNPSKQAYKKHKAAHGGSDNKPKSQREIAKQERANYKKKKLPKTSFGLALKNRNLSDAEFREASKRINRDREVAEGVIRDLYSIEKFLNFPNQVLNDGVKAVRSVDYIVGKIKGTKCKDVSYGKFPMTKAGEEFLGNKIYLPYTFQEFGNFVAGKDRVNGKASYANYINSKFKTTTMDSIKNMPLSDSEYNKRMSQFNSNKFFGHSDTITIPSLQHDDMKDVDNYLCHYGRKGMKWGHHIFSDPNQPLSKEYLRYFNNDGSLNRFGQRVINSYGGTSKKHQDFINKHKYEMKERLHNTKQKKDNEYSDNNIYFEGTGKTTKGKKYIKNLAKQISLGKVTEFKEDKKGYISSSKTQKGNVIRDADGNRVIWGDYLAAERIARKRGYIY